MTDIELLEQQAVDAAINLQWEIAIKLNKQIIKLDKNNGPAYLRLGFAYLQSKEIEKAKKHYLKALKIQPRNTVALQNLERIKILEKRSPNHKASGEKSAFDPSLFLEIIGKTKNVALVNLGQKNVLAELYIGELVELKIKKRRVEVRTQHGDYIGSLPDDVSKRLITFLKAKSKYSTFIKESEINRVVVFIREDKKGKAVSHHISFPLTTQRSNEFENIKINDEDKTDENDHDHEHDDDRNDWEKMAEELGHEEKEDIIDIQSEEELDEE